MTPEPAPGRARELDSLIEAPQLPLVERALDDAIGEARRTVDRADRAHPGAVARFALFSGGNDSSVMLDVVADRCDAVVHINTGIGIPETRDFVRSRAAEHGLELIELHPPGVTYREWVLDHGFPGPAAHLYMYRQLKERALRQLIGDTLGRGRDKRVILYSGVRTAESARRRRNFGGRDIHRTGRTIWVAPVLGFTTAEIAAYRARFALPLNEVAVHLHMSGECLCGAFARPGELDEIAFWYPDVAEEIRTLEAQVAAAGHRQSRRGAGSSRRRARVGPLCSSCTLFDPDTYARP